MSPEDLRQQLQQRPVQETAALLLGAKLVAPGLVAELVEVEAYGGPDDLGSHGHRGPTRRNAPMFGPPGCAYCYLNYGVHWLLNVVAHPQGEAAAILIRAAVPVDGLELLQERRPKARRVEDLLSGPGKIGAGFTLGPEINHCDLLDPHQPVHLIPATRPCSTVLVGTRVGLAPGKGDHLPWRFVDAERLAFVSRPHRFLTTDR